MMPRTLGERLIHDLTQIRSELHEAVDPIPDTDLDYAPEPSMKSYRKQLVEIGSMLAESTIFLTEDSVVDFRDCEAFFDGETFRDLMGSLDEFLNRLVERLKSADDAWFSRTREIPDDWASYFGAKQIEPEELVRWVARHEYYHLAQIVTYRWIQGHNPYRRA